MNTIGVIGSGVMGSGLAQSLAQFDINVILVDVSDAILEKAKQEIIRNIRFQAFFKQPIETSIQILERIIFTTDYNLLSKADFIIENATEKWEIKKDIYNKIDLICPDHVVFAVNTSAISITKIAALTNRPKKVVGMHFMNPVPLKPMVEVIRGYHTSEETIAMANALLHRMKKEGVVVNDVPGFVTNRVLMLMINEAVFLLHDQVASVHEVDKIFKGCFGHKMGPLETADLIGLDTILFSIEVLYESYNDSKYRPCPLLKKMVDAGLHGVKSGEGFYIHASPQ